jgi:DNA-binding phage protein
LSTLYERIFNQKGENMNNMIDVQAIQEKLKTHNLRKVAVEIGMHENTLYRFMNNRDPRYSTVKKITDWLNSRGE